MKHWGLWLGSGWLIVEAVDATAAQAIAAERGEESSPRLIIDYTCEHGMCSCSRCIRNHGACPECEAELMAEVVTDFDSEAWAIPDIYDESDVQY